MCALSGARPQKCAFHLTKTYMDVGKPKVRFLLAGKSKILLGEESQVGFRALFGLSSQRLRCLRRTKPNHHLKPQRKSAAKRDCADVVVTFSDLFRSEIVRKCSVWALSPVESYNVGLAGEGDGFELSVRFCTAKCRPVRNLQIAIALQRILAAKSNS